jgi:hypothetical protein
MILMAVYQSSLSSSPGNRKINIRAGENAGALGFGDAVRISETDYMILLLVHCSSWACKNGERSQQKKNHVFYGFGISRSNAGCFNFIVALFLVLAFHAWVNWPDYTSQQEKEVTRSYRILVWFAACRTATNHDDANWRRLPLFAVRGWTDMFRFI